MIRLHCASCGQEVEVASMIAAGSQVCAACGRMVIGGADPHPPAGSPPPGEGARPPDAWDYQTAARRERPAQSAGVTVLGIVLIVLSIPGLLVSFCCGGAFGQVFLLPTDSTEWRKLRQNNPEKARELEEKLQQLQGILVFALVYVGVSSALQLVSGVGVLRRRQWGRYLALGNGGLSCLAAFAIALNGGDPCTVIGYFIFFAVVVAILLSEKGVAEFRHPGAWSFP